MAPVMGNTSKKILVADGDESFRNSLRTFINRLGHEMFEAATGLETIDKASNLRPDLIIMDVRLPVMNGEKSQRN